MLPSLKNDTNLRVLWDKLFNGKHGNQVNCPELGSSEVNVEIRKYVSVNHSTWCQI